jgi:hypothetical protein
MYYNYNIKKWASMTKKHDNRIIMVFKLFWDGIVWYCRYMDVLLKYMAFPVFGQIIGLFLIFLATYFFVLNIPDLIKQFAFLDNMPLVFTLLLVCVFPGFFIFCKAFYDYLIAMAALNSVAYVSRGDKMKNKPLSPQTHADLLKNRIAKYVVFLLILSIFFLIGSFPLFIIPFGIICVYLALVFQVFMLEESTSPTAVFKRSFDLVKTNFAITCLLICLSAILTYFILPALFVWGFEKINAVNFLSFPIQKYLEILPIQDAFNSLSDSIIPYLSQTEGFTPINISSLIDLHAISCEIVKMIISCSVIAFLLPMRCCWFTLLYSVFDFEKNEELRKVDYKKEFKESNKNRSKKG